MKRQFKHLSAASMTLCLTFSGFEEKTAAQTATATAGGSCYYWIDVATGRPWPSVPLGSSPQDFVPGSNEWTNPRNGKSAAQLSDGSWINVANGQSWPSAPLGSSPQDFVPGSNEWTNPRNGKSAAFVPCPPPPSSVQPGTASAPAPPPPIGVLPGVGFGFRVGPGHDDRDRR